MSAISVDGDLVHYEVLGRGRAVVLVHGWFGSWRYWIPTMQQLHLKYRVYAVDLFGYGDSAKNPQRYSIEHQVRLMSELMSQLGLKKAAMIGHGLGAHVLTEFAQRNQDKIARLLLTSAPLLDPGDLDTRIPPGQRILLNNSEFNATRAIHNAEALQRRKEADQDKTVANRNDVDSHQEATILNDRLINRSRLREAALARAEAEMIRNTEAAFNAAPKAAPEDNALYQNIGKFAPETLLGKCFKKSEVHYEKLNLDVTKMDNEVVSVSTKNYDAGRTLDILRALDIPVVLVHGTEDPLIPEPSDDVWNYLVGEKENLMLPLPIESRHFPMLESEDYFKIIGGFLEQQDITNISIKTRWRRRSR